MFRASMCEMNRSDIACCLWSRRTIFSLPTRRMTLGVMASALPMRTGWPARHPSPKNSPGPSIATTASRPVLERTNNFTPPRWMYITLLQRSPCEKVASDRAYSTISFDSPAESRNARALKLDVRLPIRRGYTCDDDTRCAQRNTRFSRERVACGRGQHVLNNFGRRIGAVAPWGGHVVHDGRLDPRSAGRGDRHRPDARHSGPQSTRWVGRPARTIPCDVQNEVTQVAKILKIAA